MRVLIRFSIDDLVATAEVRPLLAITLTNALVKAGYVLRLSAPGAVATKASFQLVRNPGPSLPNLPVQRRKRLPKPVAAPPPPPPRPLPADVLETLQALKDGRRG